MHNTTSPVVPPRHQEPSDDTRPGAPPSTADTLVMYQGGGYSGCWWEWNCYLLDKDDKFHDIYSSGREGISDEEEARDKLQDEKWVESSKAELIKLTDKDAVIKFTEDFNGTMVRGVFKFLVNGDYPYELHFRCETCKEECSHHIPNTHHMVCSGGLAYSDRDIHCEDCHDEHSCDECREFWEDISNFIGGYCEFCAKGRCMTCDEQFDEDEIDTDHKCSVCRTIEVPDPHQPNLFEELP